MKYQDRVAKEYEGYMKDEEKYVKARNKDKLTNYQPPSQLTLEQSHLASKLDD
jgi:hypothetical protein